MIFVVLIGGIGTLEGPVLGTVVFFVLQQTLASYGGWCLIVVGAVAVGMAVWARQGLWGRFPAVDRDVPCNCDLFDEGETPYDFDGM